MGVGLTKRDGGNLAIQGCCFGPEAVLSGIRVRCLDDVSFHVTGLQTDTAGEVTGGAKKLFEVSLVR